jgi:MGT family glycosyltransferase
VSKTFLFVLWAGGGNVPPQLTLARRVAERGHEVRVLAPAVLRTAVEAAGLGFEPYVDAPEHDESVPARSLVRDFEAKTPMGAAKRTREGLLIGMAGPIAQDVGRILERRHIDVVASDVMLLGGFFASEAAGVPSAMLVHTIYPFPRPGVPPFGMGWAAANDPLARARNAAGSWMFRRFYESPSIPRLNAVRGKVRLPAIRSFDDLLARVGHVLVLTSEAFDFPGPLPANARYVGPQVDEADATPKWTAPWPEGDLRPLVVVGLSTTYQAHGNLLQRAVDALGRLPVKAFVSAGALTVEHVPENVYVAPYAPHSRLLPLADVVVTHAGLGTVHAALAHGKPLVCLPLGRDQGDNAARLVARGAAIRLSAKASSSKIAEAVSEVLGDARYAAAAQRLSVAMRYDEARGSGADALVDVAGEASSARPRRAA